MTKQEWIDSFPSPYQECLTCNTAEYMQGARKDLQVFLNANYRYAGSALLNMFSFASTAQGDSFWFKIASQLEKVGTKEALLQHTLPAIPNFPPTDAAVIDMPSQSRAYLNL